MKYKIEIISIILIFIIGIVEYWLYIQLKKLNENNKT